MSEAIKSRICELTLRLTDTQLEQLRKYVIQAGDDGYYYGNCQQWVARHKAIKEALAISDRVDGWDYQ